MSFRKKKLDPSLANVDLHTDVVLRQGWLEKQGGNVKSWKNRWFVLNSTFLVYSKSAKAKDQQAPQGVIKVADILGVNEIESPHKKKKFAFAVATENRTFMCACEAAAVRDAWIKSLIDASASTTAKRDAIVKATKAGLNLVGVAAGVRTVPSDEAAGADASSGSGDGATAGEGGDGTIVIIRPAASATAGDGSGSGSQEYATGTMIVTKPSAADAPAKGTRKKVKRHRHRHHEEPAGSAEEDGNFGTMIRTGTGGSTGGNSEDYDAGTMVRISDDGGGSAEPDDDDGGGTMVRVSTSKKSQTGARLAPKAAPRKASEGGAAVGERPAFLKYLDEHVDEPVTAAKPGHWDAFSVGELDAFVKALETQRSKELAFVTKQFEELRVAVLHAMSGRKASRPNRDSMAGSGQAAAGAAASPAGNKAASSKTPAKAAKDGAAASVAAAAAVKASRAR